MELLQLKSIKYKYLPSIPSTRMNKAGIVDQPRPTALFKLALSFLFHGPPLSFRIFCTGCKCGLGAYLSVESFFPSHFLRCFHLYMGKQQTKLTLCSTSLILLWSPARKKCDKKGLIKVVAKSTNAAWQTSCMFSDLVGYIVSLLMLLWLCYYPPHSRVHIQLQKSALSIKW